MTNLKFKSCSRKSRSVLFGLLIVAVGALFLAINLGWLDSGLRQVVFSWPMVFVVFAIIALATRSYWTALFWTALGTFFLLPRIAAVYPEALPGIDGNFASNYWPVLLILLGIGVILYILFGKKRFFWTKMYSADSSDYAWSSSNIEGTNGAYHRDVMFGGHSDIFLEPVFRGGNIDILFGGVELDLRKTTLPEGDTYLNIDVLFGGVVLNVPEDWVVVSKADALFGGVENKHTQATNADRSRRLVVKTEALFGGCQIR